MEMMKNNSRSPLKDKPLRYVAQSADESLDDFLHEKLLIPYIAGVMCIAGVIFTWLHFLRPIQSPPILITIFFGIGVLIFSYQVVQNIRKVKFMKQGRDGERAVGQYLELFREEGCHVFHDIIGPNFNIDHVVICDRGIFVIETKTYSKSQTGQSKIYFNGQRLLINGQEPYKDIIIQVKAATNHLQSILRDSTGKEFSPFPVVLFPGWYIEGEGNKQGKMWVLEPKAFRKFLQAKKQVLSGSDVKLASYHLSRHIRATQSEI